MVDQEKVEAPPSGSARTDTQSWPNESVNKAVAYCVNGPGGQAAPSLPSILCSGPVSPRKETTSGHPSPHPAGSKLEGKDIGPDEKIKDLVTGWIWEKGNNMSLWGLKIKKIHTCWGLKIKKIHVD